jgi:hypothetical protein
VRGSDRQHVDGDRLVAASHFETLGPGAGMVGHDEGIQIRSKHHFTGRRALNARWRKGNHLEPDWKIEHGYLVDIQGQPCVRTRLEVYPAADFHATSFSDFMVLGMIMTALPAVNAIPHVCGARPGIVTYLDLPFVAPRGWVRSR